MRILILGAGVVGVASAYYLAQAGHEVEVLDRQPAAGMETSFANAGQVSPGYSAPWAAPGIPVKALKWLLMRHSPLVVRPGMDPHLYAWVARMLANCTEQAYARNKGRMVRLAEYSRDKLKELRAQTGIAYDERAKGTLQLFRTQQQLDHVHDDTRVLDAHGVPYDLLDPAGCIAAEPALARVREKFVGGLRLPGDETGDAHLFTQALAALAEKLGVRFRYGVAIEALRKDANRVTGVALAGGEMVTADVYVAAMGSYTPGLLRPLGLMLPVYPVKGYSITLPIVDPAGAPVSTVMDETYKVAITRLGDRIRVGGTAELAGFDLSLREPRRQTLIHSVFDLYPNGGDLERATFWTGLRPMTPDGTPIIGGTSFANLFTNTGHGTLGWTMACGSGSLIADIISGKPPAIIHADLALDRYGAAA
ncbi:MAG: D-amino acid dehydrogenase small subunit [Rhizobiales bacterium 24-66-13]|jgi:D-amino-acid dehydrogenase|uniref:D-amino acid dehydrogenase n=1 Tax=Roseixanthobacter finlandensis TaxID=3119922 RepID=UPI000BDA589D|nr:MAG: D-amino acid dehydrogenase small subunit [Rhizobiales bacterium 12-66-7]OYY88226.1 MAG: D-amino acid dehydrogenase small subunit [Rhizobiales bacterium 35-66-30]OYZ82129.1 MAG: D-amino acid dehydrogenase small subunit [Rhizobiales bacterium 24-66-13]OZB11036.1 MAG: D-amino acid dehydrogenase small subunit [Rhizobiales bacterium 39-66-18]HQS47484.1 D-amino acid dehydrogenase [Xanthobacteraceae bacterium]